MSLNEHVCFAAFHFDVFSKLLISDKSHHWIELFELSLADRILKQGNYAECISKLNLLHTNLEISILGFFFISSSNVTQNTIYIKQMQL